ncbi:unnamed protein product [Sympodiomycopsis kandeliae]
MDSLLKAGQSFLQNQQGGNHNNNNNDNNNNNNYNGGGGGGGGNVGGFDLGSIMNAAQNHDQGQNNSGGNSDLFAQATSFLQNKHGNNPDGDINEDELIQSHEKVNNGQGAHSNEIGQAAALGAIKNFIGGSNSNESSGGGFQQKIIGMAMSQAAQMFDQKAANGEVSGGDKQSAVNQAGEAAMKLLIKHQVTGMIGGGSGSGGLGSLAKLLM